MRIGIVGTGHISESALLAISKVPQLDPVAIYARPHSRARGEEIAAANGFSVVHTDLGDMMADPNVDAVYIALINSMHFPAAKTALEAGKHVLLEKPFTTTAAQARELAELAQASGLFLMEAITPRHSPVYERIRAELANIGPVRMVRGNYSQHSSRYDRYLEGEVAPIFDPATFGGALFDLNVYNLAPILGLFGPPESLRYEATVGHNGVDTSGIVVMRYPGFIATATAAKDSASRSYLTIQGEKGWLEVRGAPNEMQAVEIHAGDREEVYEPDRGGHRMVQEFRDFEAMVRTGDREWMGRELEASIAVMEAFDAAAASSGIVYGSREDATGTDGAQ